MWSDLEKKYSGMFKGPAQNVWTRWTQTPLRRGHRWWIIAVTLWHHYQTLVSSGLVWFHWQLRSCVKVEGGTLGSPSLIVLMVPVDVKQIVLTVSVDVKQIVLMVPVDVKQIVLMVPVDAKQQWIWTPVRCGWLLAVGDQLRFVGSTLRECECCRQIGQLLHILLTCGHRLTSSRRTASVSHWP